MTVLAVWEMQKKNIDGFFYLYVMYRYIYSFYVGIGLTIEFIFLLYIISFVQNLKFYFMKKFNEKPQWY